MPFFFLFRSIVCIYTKAERRAEKKYTLPIQRCVLYRKINQMREYRRWNENNLCRFFFSSLYRNWMSAEFIIFIVSHTTVFLLQLYFDFCPILLNFFFFFRFIFFITNAFRWCFVVYFWSHWYTKLWIMWESIWNNASKMRLISH